MSPKIKEEAHQNIFLLKINSFLIQVGHSVIKKESVCEGFSLILRCRTQTLSFITE
jgi:hypothetical protein